MSVPGRNRSARVCLDGRPVGRLEETEEGTRFSYATAYVSAPDAVPISLVLPLRLEPYDTRKVLHPVFYNLLPEGWLLELSVAKLKISADDEFGLLLATGRDCIGAIEILPETDRG